MGGFIVSKGGIFDRGCVYYHGSSGEEIYNIPSGAKISFSEEERIAKKTADSIKIKINIKDSFGK